MLTRHDCLPGRFQPVETRLIGENDGQILVQNVNGKPSCPETAFPRRQCGSVRGAYFTILVDFSANANKFLLL